MLRNLPTVALLVSSLVVPAGCKKQEQREKRDPVAAKNDAPVSKGPWEFGTTPPGTPGFTDALVSKLKSAWRARAKQYKPRTRHFRDDGSPKYTNRLFLQSSPYLLQHAHNPVNWYPWGDEAFETAKKLGRPVLLSVGYSTCHWCHVMEEQSFEDEEVAEYLNRNYIVIKVDREERPDVDQVYMTATRNLSGRGGWPMTVWLTPDKKPFFAGTYFPRERFLAALTRLKEDYDRDPAVIADEAAAIAVRVQQQLEVSVDLVDMDLPDADLLHKAAGIFIGRLDKLNGGGVGRPKFPSSMPVRFLLRYHRRTGNAKALQAATLTLDKMAAGGIYDDVGGGFHRYSTDARWLVPHFEKMLYDNALLTMAYAEAYQQTGRADYARVVRETLRFVQRDMTSPDGAFYSATDADSLGPSGEREEGYFFTWTPDELVTALGEERAKMISAYYGVSARGNFEGRTIFNITRSIAEVAKELAVPPATLTKVIAESKEILYVERLKRPLPLRDDKVLTAWNGLMISAHAQAAIALREPELGLRAARAAEFLWNRARDKRGRLLRSVVNGKASLNAYLEDYAFLCAGMLDLYEATHNPKWLRRAIELDRIVDKHYEDKQGAGFFRTSDDHEKLLAREKPRYDGAVPTGTSIHLQNLLRLFEFTTKVSYQQRAELAFGNYVAMLRRAPSAMSEMLLAIDYYLDRPKQIVIVGVASREEAAPFIDELSRVFLPNRALVVTHQAEIETQAALVPLVSEKIAQRGQPTAYVCEQRVCELPTRDPAVFARQLRKVHKLSAPP